MRIGVVGLGRMGAAMAARLIEQGCELAVWNRSAAALNEVAGLGAEPVATPEDLWDRCDFVLSSLTDDQALEEVYLGSGGLLGSRAGGKIAVDTSTVLPRTIRRLAEKAAAVGCQLLDSPVLGTSAPARQGQLIVMVGGDPSAFERALPLLRLLGRNVRHLGPSGSGAAMKLSVNIPMSAYWAALSESLALAACNGLDVRDVIEIIQDSPAALAQLPLKFEILMGRSTQVGFAIEGVAKDLKVILAAAGTAVNLPVVKASLLKYRAATEIGAGAEDVASITHHHRALHQAVRPA